MTSSPFDLAVFIHAETDIEGQDLTNHRRLKALLPPFNCQVCWRISLVDATLQLFIHGVDGWR